LYVIICKQKIEAIRTEYNNVTETDGRLTTAMPRYVEHGALKRII